MLRRVLAITSALATALALAVPAQAGSGADHPTGTLTGTLGGADYEIRVPEDWNGTLVVYAHGYSFDPVTASAGFSDDVEAALLAEGYALAGSAYSDAGWAVKEGVHDTLALTQRFNGLVGHPDEVILYGVSMGSIVTFESAERYPGAYDGAVALCSVGAGAPEAWDGSLTLALALDAVGWWDPAWGTPADVTDGVMFDPSSLLAKLGTDPLASSKLAFLASVTDVIPWLDGSGGLVRPEDFSDPLAFVASVDIAATLNAFANPWLFTDTFFGTQARGELEARAGGPVVQNLDDLAAGVYAGNLSPGELFVIDTLLAGDSAGWLDAMQVEVAPTPNARNYVERHADYTGRIRMPVLTMHTHYDGLVPPAHTDAYGETVAAAGRSDQLLQTYTSGLGHCAFTTDQVVTAITAMDAWIGGDVPELADFPSSLGFLPGYEPRDWPY